MLVTLTVLSVMPMIYMGKFDPMSFFESGVSSGMSEFKALKAKAPKNLTSVVTNEKVQVYKWRDEHGVVQFSNTPPLESKKVERVELNPNKNIVKAIKVPVKEEPKAVAQTDMPTPYSVKGMKKVVNDAKGVEKLLQQRHADQQKMMDGL